MAKATTAARTRKKVRKVVNDGIVHIHASFNNTIITILASLLMFNWIARTIAIIDIPTTKLPKSISFRNVKRRAIPGPNS